MGTHKIYSGIQGKEITYQGVYMETAMNHLPNIPSSRVASFYTSCSVHEKCSNLTGFPWKRGAGASFLLFIR